ncbi:MAG TPA: hypothetical protein VGE05_10565 [Novosphingobium sp.]
MLDAVEKLKRVIDDDNRYEIPQSDVAELQIQAANELFQDRVRKIKFLRHRAEEVGVTEVRERADLVGLLFAHTTYKSYPESWLTDEKWPLLSKWVDTMSTHRVEGIDFDGIENIDGWIDRMAAGGHYLSCSSGTTGKSAVLNASAADMERAKKNMLVAICWGAGVEPRQEYLQFSAAAVAQTPRNMITGRVMQDAFIRTDVKPFKSPIPPITLGGITGMVALRKRVADGVATPQEIAEYEKTSAERAAAIEGSTEVIARAMIEARKEKIFVSGMWGRLYEVAEAVRNMGYSGKDFNPDNFFFSAGGLKGAKVPPNYREYVFETFNIRPERVAQNYSMQEIATAMPRCSHNRYHLPPWLMCLVLDENGEALVPHKGGGEIEGRAGFFDLSIDGRWNGVISGDKIGLTYDRCDCGNPSPSIRDDITRYADMAGGDKITCAGTVDAYVRGIS